MTVSSLERLGFLTGVRQVQCRKLCVLVEDQGVRDPLRSRVRRNICLRKSRCSKYLQEKRLGRTDTEMKRKRETGARFFKTLIFGGKGK